MLDILAVIAPIFMLIGLGYLAVRLALFPQDKLAALYAKDEAINVQFLKAAFTELEGIE